MRRILGLGLAVAGVLGIGEIAIAATGLAFKDSFGNLYIYGLSPYASIQINLGTGKHPVTQRRTANACGYVRISQASLGTTIQLPTTSGALASFATANLTTVQNPPVCRQGRIYLANGWQWPTATATATTTGTTGTTTTSSTGTTSTTTTGTTTSTTGTTGTTSTGTTGSTTSNIPAGYSQISLPGVSKIGTAIVVSGLTPGGSYKLQLLASSTPIYSGAIPTPDACGVSQGSVAALSGSTSYGYKILDSSSVAKYSGTLSTIPSLPYSVVQCLNGAVYGK